MESCTRPRRRCSLSLAGATTSIMFVATKHVFCRDNSMLAAKKICLSRQKFLTIAFVARQNFCRDKLTKVCLSRQKFCRAKIIFVVTKIILVAAPACDSSHPTACNGHQLCWLRRASSGQAVVSRAVLWGVGSSLAKAVSFHLWYFVPIPGLAVGGFSWYSGFLSALLGNAPCTSTAKAFKCLTAMFTGDISVTSQYQGNSGSDTAPNGRNLPPASCCRCPGIRQTERTQYHHYMKTNFLWTSQVQEVILLPKQTRQCSTFFQSKEQTTII